VRDRTSLNHKFLENNFHASIRNQINQRKNAQVGLRNISSSLHGSIHLRATLQGRVDVVCPILLRDTEHGLAGPLLNPLRPRFNFKSFKRLRYDLSSNNSETSAGYVK